jgi:hypothetical protein
MNEWSCSWGHDTGCGPLITELELGMHLLLVNIIENFGCGSQKVLVEFQCIDLWTASTGLLSFAGPSLRPCVTVQSSFGTSTFGVVTRRGFLP